MAALMYSFLFFVIVTIVFSPIVDSASPAKDQKEQKFTPRIQIRAILIRCPQHIIPDNKVRGGGNSNDDKVISVLRTDDIMRFSGFDKDELLMHSEVKNCKRKMIITMMINNFGRTVTEEEFVVVDHVYDPDLHKRSRLLNPLVFKIKQDAVLQLYGMRYLQSVNAMAREEVLNKGMNNFTGCDTASSQPTCGMVYHNNRVVPFSEGFCCSCDSYVNLQRQPGLSLVRQQKMFSNRKENHFVDEKDSVDYSHQQSKRDIDRQSKRDIDRQSKRDIDRQSKRDIDRPMNRQSKDEDIENRDNLLKKSNNLDVLRSKYMSSDFDFAKNGFYTPQIVRKNRLSGDNFNKFSNPEEVRSWEHRGRLYDVGDKGGRILWNNENFEQIPSEEEENGGEKKRRSVDEKGIVDKEGGKKNEPKVGLDIVDKGIEKGRHLRDESKPKLNTGMFDENVGMKNCRNLDSEALHELGENEEKEIVDESSEMKEYLGVDGRFDVSLTENSGEIVDENGGMEERRGVVNDQEQVINSLNSEEGTFDEGVSKSRLNNGGVGEDEVSGNKEPLNGDGNLRDVENGIVEGGLKNIKERSVHDDLDSLIRNSMRVTDEKPFLLKPKDWTSLKALKLRVKGAKPNSPQFKGTYQPAHRYVKVLEENPVLENAKGFQMSDYRPRWNPNAKVSFKKPTPWEVIPKKCASDKRNKSILRILTKLNEERCHPDPFGEEDSKVFDSLMRSIEKKLVRSCRSNVNESNNNFDNNSTIIMNNRSQCEEAWSELQTLLLEQAIDEKLTLHDRKLTTNESSILLNEGDKKVIDRLKRQITRWVDHNYELDLSNIYNNNSSFNNEGGVLLPLNGDYLYYVDSVRNFENGLGRLHESPHNLYGISSEIDVRKNPQNFVNNSEKVPGLKDVEFLSEGDASGLNEFGERYRHGLGLVSSAGKSEPDSNSVENFGKSIPNEQSKIYDENKYLKNLSNDNIALKYPELPLEEKIGGNYYADNKVNDDHHFINNIGKEISAKNEFHLNPPLHFHSDSGPVFIDVSKYGPLLDTQPIKLSKSSPHPYSLLPNDLSFINPQEFDKTRNDVPNKFTMKSNIPAKSYLDVGLEDDRMLSARNFELVEENHDKADIKLDENSKKMNDYSAENTINLSNYNWNFKGKDDPSLQYYKVIDNKNSFLLDNKSNFNKHPLSIDRNLDSNLNKLINSKNPFLRDNNSFFNKNSLPIDRNSDLNLNNVEDFSNLNIENDVNQNAKNYVDRSSKLEYEGLGVNRGSNLYNIEDENPNKLTNNAIAFDDMPIPNNYSSYLAKNNNLSHKTYHIYKQEMESPYIINTSHAKHMPNFQVLKTSGEDMDRRLHYLEVATEFGYPPMLNTTDMQYLMQNALHSGDASENLTSVSKSAMKSSDIENVKTSVPQERLMTNGSKSGPILISGNVGNIYGQKGKLIFIPDESEEPVTTKNKIDYQNLQNVNQKLSYPTSESNISYPDSETCNIGKPPPGYGISLNSGRNNVNSKLFPSFLKNSNGNPDRNYLETNLLKDEKSQISLNSHKPQMNLVNNKLDYGLNIKCNLHADDLNKPLNNKIDGNFDTKNAQEKYDKLNFGSLNNFPKNSLDKYGYKDGENGINGGDKIEKRDTEQIESRSKKISKKVRRQVSSNGNQIRGGQNCIDRYVPSGANPITYHESAHCLRFSDLW